MRYLDRFFHKKKYSLDLEKPYCKKGNAKQETFSTKMKKALEGTNHKGEKTIIIIHYIILTHV